MNTRPIRLLAPALLLAGATTVGAFENMGFDSPGPGFPPPGGCCGSITVAEAVPGWNAYAGGQPVHLAFYNTIPLDTSCVGIIDSNSPYFMPKPLFSDWFGEGYAAVLAAGLGGDIWLTQTGEISADCHWVTFWTTGPTGMTQPPNDIIRFAVNGQELPLQSIDSYEGWTRWRTDVSAFAGTTAQIGFSLKSYWAPDHQGAYEMYLDDISGLPIPEPETEALLTFGAILLAAFGTCRVKRRAAPWRSSAGLSPA